MKIINQVKLELINNSQNEAFARAAVAAFVSQTDVTLEELSDIKTAVSEAVTNAIVHGYNNRAGFVKVVCKILDNEVIIPERIIQIEVIDSGCGIADIKKARQPLFTTQPEMERSGMGFTVMETFMDEVSVESELNQGTTVILRKTIREKSDK
jgi:stage II sporulation protein AB (anti-sigma F factor)